MLKTIFQKIFSMFGYKITKKINIYSFDTIYKKEINESSIIFDVGANRGQSIERFRKNFPNCIIHCFEPLEKEIVNDNFRIYAIDHIKGFKSIYEYMFGVYALYFNEKYKKK